MVKILYELYTSKLKGTGYLVGWMIFACVLLLAIFGIANYKKKDA